MPNVRPKPPSAPKNADIAALRSSRLGEVRSSRVAGLIDLDGLAVAQRDRRIREVGVGEDAVDVRRRAGQRAGVGQELLLGVGQRVRRAADDVAQVERVGLQPRLGCEELLDRRAADPQDLGLDERRLRRRSSRRAAASPAACPAARRRACPGRPACWRRRRAATAPCRAATSARARRPASAADAPSLPCELAQLRQLRRDRRPSRRATPLGPDRRRPGSTCRRRHLRAVAFLPRHQHRSHQTVAHRSGPGRMARACMDMRLPVDRCRQRFYV